MAARREQAEAVNEALTTAYPDARCALDFTNPLELLVATVLSAQTTDVRVNSVTPELFAEFPTAADYANARLERLEEILRPLGFFRAKAKSVQGLGARLESDYDGEVPATLADLETDPVKVEADIAKLLPEEEWTMACHRLIFHGRQICHSRKPACMECPIADLCPSFPLV